MSLGTALHALESELIEYLQLPLEEQKKLRHTVYQQCGEAGKILFYHFVPSYSEWIKNRSWFVNKEGRCMTYGAINDRILWASEPRFIGLTVDVAWSMYSTENPGALRKGVQ